MTLGNHIKSYIQKNLLSLLCIRSNPVTSLGNFFSWESHLGEQNMKVFTSLQQPYKDEIWLLLLILER